MNYEIEELIKRYIYLYENKELILALCISRGTERQKILTQLKKYKNLLKKNTKYKRDEKLSKLLKEYVHNYKTELNTEKYYLMANVNDSIVAMFEDFLFSDSAMEKLDLYNHVEAVKINKNYLEAFNLAIELLEERRNCNMQLKNLPTFTVWKILSYVRRKNTNNKILLTALDKYYNIDRFIITGEDCISGYNLLEYDYNSLSDDILEKYPNSANKCYNNIIFSYENCFEIEDEYFSKTIDNEISNNTYNNVAKSNFMLYLANMSNLDLEIKNIIKNKLNCSKPLVKNYEK